MVYFQPIALADSAAPHESVESVRHFDPLLGSNAGVPHLVECDHSLPDLRAFCSFRADQVRSREGIIWPSLAHYFGVRILAEDRCVASG